MARLHRPAFNTELDVLTLGKMILVGSLKDLPGARTSVIELQVSVNGVVPGSVAVLCEARKRDDRRWSVW